jgi:hypothetical protein
MVFVALIIMSILLGTAAMLILSIRDSAILVIFLFINWGVVFWGCLECILAKFLV